MIDRLKDLSESNTALGKARYKYLMLEAERHHREANLIQRSLGKSHAEKQNSARATVEWLEFHQQLARAESEYEFLKLRHEILNKAWLFEYQQQKLDDGLIKKGGE